MQISFCILNKRIIETKQKQNISEDKEMRIIVVGCGKVGTTLIDSLSKEKHDITVIDTNSAVLSDVSNTYDVMGIVGNGVSYTVQMEAGIEQTDLLIAVTDSDEVNLLCCLIAKKAGNASTIARVRSPLYSREISYIKDELGLSMIINPEYAAATEISRILRFPSADKIDTFSNGRVEILKYLITENSIIKDCTLIEVSRKTKSDVLICAVERGDDVFIPNGNFILRANDKISIIAAPRNAKEFFAAIGEPSHQVKNTMIIGGGMIAYYLANQIISSGISVKIIEQDRKRCEELSELLPKAKIINGDASNQDVLNEEGVDGVESFVALTGIDESNIFLSLFARNKTKGKIITKINRIAYDDIISTFNLGSLISPKNITAEYIVRYVRAMQNSIGSNVLTMYKLIENKAEALEFEIGANSPVSDKELSKLKLKRNILIGSINHNGIISIPNGQSVIRTGDKVVIITTGQGLNDIKDILE